LKRAGVGFSRKVRRVFDFDQRQMSDGRILRIRDLLGIAKESVRPFQRLLDAIGVFGDQHADFVARELVHLPLDSDLGGGERRHMFGYIGDMSAVARRGAVCRYLPFGIPTIFRLVDMAEDDRDAELAVMQRGLSKWASVVPSATHRDL
jgi:hypothetical protein